MHLNERVCVLWEDESEDEVGGGGGGGGGRGGVTGVATWNGVTRMRPFGLENFFRIQRSPPPHSPPL